jgi:murein tripeptide amidase MpaA
MAYLNVDEIEAVLNVFAASYPNVVEVIALPNPTAEGRRSHALRIGPEDGAGAPAIVITGGVHAREWVPPDALVNLAADLLEAHSRETGLRYGGKRFSADDVRTVVENLQLILFPCVNPDGRHHSQTADPMWRKNRRKVNPTLPPNCVGVDINRNFDALWDFQRHFAADSGVSASDDPCHPQAYVGPGAASEAETRNVVWLLNRDPGTQWFIDVHSYVPAIYHTWGFDENQTSDPSMSFLNSAFDGQRGRAGDTYREYILPEDLEAAMKLGSEMNDAIAAASEVAYELGQSFSLYPTSGASDDYAYSRRFVRPGSNPILGFTIECGRAFQPPWAEAEDVIREVCAGIIAFYLTAIASHRLVDRSVAHVQG